MAEPTSDLAVATAATEACARFMEAEGWQATYSVFRELGIDPGVAIGKLVLACLPEEGEQVIYLLRGDYDAVLSRPLQPFSGPDQLGTIMEIGDSYWADVRDLPEFHQAVERHRATLT